MSRLTRKVPKLLEEHALILSPAALEHTEGAEKIAIRGPIKSGRPCATPWKTKLLHKR